MNVDKLNLTRIYIGFALGIFILSLIGYFFYPGLPSEEKFDLATQSNIMFHLWFALTGLAPKPMIAFGLERIGKHKEALTWFNFASAALFGFFLLALYDIVMKSIEEDGFYEFFFIGRPFGLLLGALSLKQYGERKKLKTPHNNK